MIEDSVLPWQLIACIKLSIKVIDVGDKDVQHQDHKGDCYKLHVKDFGQSKRHSGALQWKYSVELLFTFRGGKTSCMLNNYLNVITTWQLGTKKT